LANLGHIVGDQSVRNILKEHGIEPAPERKRGTSWETFLKAHWETLGAIDFTTVEIWTVKGLVTMYILVVMELKSRRIEIAGITANPDGKWIRQVCRNLTSVDDGFLRNTTHLLVDRDTKFQPLRQYMTDCSRLKPVLLPPRSPNLNSYLERYMRSLKSEALERMLFFGEGSLRRTLDQYAAHFHGERNHQGLENKLIDPGPEVGSVAGKIECRERLGGLLRYYHRAA
jgi:transposase InsO family protein